MKDTKLVEKILKMSEKDVALLLSKCLYIENDLIPCDIGSAISLLRSSFHVPRCMMILDAVKMVRQYTINNKIIDDYGWILLVADVKQIFVTILVTRFTDEDIRKHTKVVETLSVF